MIVDKFQILHLLNQPKKVISDNPFHTKSPDLVFFLVNSVTGRRIFTRGDILFDYTNLESSDIIFY